MKADPWWRRYWRSLGFGPEVAEELDFHVEMLTRELVAKGLAPEAARAEAVRRFGDRTRCKRSWRRSSGVGADACGSWSASRSGGQMSGTPLVA